MRVMHVAADLGTYGAERFVVLLLEHLSSEPDLELAALTLAAARPGDAPPAVALRGRSQRALRSCVSRPAGRRDAGLEPRPRPHPHARREILGPARGDPRRRS